MLTHKKINFIRFYLLGGWWYDMYFDQKALKIIIIVQITRLNL